MTISEIKPLLVYGDIKQIAKMCGYSAAHVDRILNVRGNTDTEGAKEIIKAATKLIKLREKIQNPSRNIRTYNRKNKAS